MSIDSNPGISSFGKGHTKVNKIPEYKRVKRYQKKSGTQKQIETAFGIYYIARNFESFSKWYNQMFKR